MVKQEYYNEEIRKEVESKPVGQRSKYLNSRGEKKEDRKVHMTAAEIIANKERWENEVKGVPVEIKEKAGENFFNPFKQGCYYWGIQSLYLLGCNEYHTDKEVKSIMESEMSKLFDKKGNNLWDKFKYKQERDGSRVTKDVRGRILGNFKTLQRLGGRVPYAYKLKQVFSCIDIMAGEDRVMLFRLRTGFSEGETIAPIYESGKRKGRGRKVEDKQVKSLEVKETVETGG